MELEGGRVTIAHLSSRAGASAADEACPWVDEFAGQHGMDSGQRTSLGLAVSEAVRAVRRGYPRDWAGEILLSVATDGTWLTVVVEDHGPGNDAPGEEAGLAGPLSLADRIELSSGAAGVGARVLMEFPMTVRRGPRYG